MTAPLFLAQFDNVDPWIFTFSFITVAVTIWMGIWSARKSKTASDFFVAGRSVSVGWNASAISGEYLSAASFMGVAGMVMSSGYDALWYPVCYACGYLFLLLFIAGPLRRFGAYTIPDFAEGRFDSPIFRKIAVVFVLFIGFFYTMPQMKGAGVTLAYIFPGLPYWGGVVAVGAVITLNVALGGMKGITLVQAFQYWAKMFAISVPIFVLMSVYGHYGKQLEMIAPDASDRPPVPGSFVVLESNQGGLGRQLSQLVDGMVTGRGSAPVLAPSEERVRVGFTNATYEGLLFSFAYSVEARVFMSTSVTNGEHITGVTNYSKAGFPEVQWRGTLTWANDDVVSGKEAGGLLMRFLSTNGISILAKGPREYWAVRTIDLVAARSGAMELTAL